MKKLGNKITSDNWTQGQYGSADGTRFCLLGHLKLKHGLQLYDETIIYGSSTDNYTNEYHLLREYIQRVKNTTIAVWNDSPGRTAKEVAELCQILDI